MATFSFNTADAPESKTFDLVPDGTYSAVALSSEIKETKTGGEMLVYKMQITDGEHANRVLWARFNTRNANPKAEEIGRRQLADFCKAAGVDEMTDTEDLCGKPVSIRVKVRPEQNGYPASNEISGFSALSHPAPRPVAPAPAPRPAAGAKPWQKAA